MDGGRHTRKSKLDDPANMEKPTSSHDPLISYRSRFDDNIPSSYTDTLSSFPTQTEPFCVWEYNSRELIRSRVRAYPFAWNMKPETLAQIYASG